LSYKTVGYNWFRIYFDVILIMLVIAWSKMPLTQSRLNGIPNPDKPELNIDPPEAERLKICGIASGFAFGYDPTGRSVFSI
jgi:hypothetical protein